MHTNDRKWTINKWNKNRTKIQHKQKQQSEYSQCRIRITLTCYCRQYSLHVPKEGWPGWVGLSGLFNTTMVYSLKVVTNPSTNRARRCLTLLIWPTPWPLRQISHQLKTYLLKISFYGGSSVHTRLILHLVFKHPSSPALRNNVFLSSGRFVNRNNGNAWIQASGALLQDPGYRPQKNLERL